jgi:hypothetical protein
MTAILGEVVAHPRQTIAELQRQLEECRAERDEALRRETATAEVLGVINSSPGDVGPVFDAIIDKALGLCAAAFGQLITFDGVGFRAAAWRGYQPDPDRTRTGPPTPGMRKDGALLGAFVIYRTAVLPFTDRQIALLQNFAAQAASLWRTRG